MPLLPAFEGEIGANGGYSIQAVLHWNYKSVSKGENSLWANLLKRGERKQFKHAFYANISV
ncbi:hypothetical protein DPMN_013275 [Dreissena polymorpha]|uniref:Uncharacterized protein n=1 Tax=Dreissena polymorpha TaxID=45954 RepID=A0A9D4N8N5_DREPO|nr:hypothetical protein DPMN_013275 [Dreissena polymorpha]